MGINTPLYFKIEMDLRKKIMAREYAPGQLLPSERELVKTYKVSRLTVREAINRLVAQGMVKKKQGKGTFVSKPTTDHNVGSLTSSSEMFLLKNYTVETKVIESEILIPDRKICEKLQLEKSENEKIFYLERVRYANHTPVSHIKCYLPYRHIDKIETIDFSTATLYRTLEDHYRLELYEAYEVIEAAKLDEMSAKFLELEAGAPVLLNRRTAYLKDGSVIEYEKVLYRSDIFKYYNKLIRRGRSELL
ncbi:MAG: GntR family transcriptional regulator [Thiotrichaceae bacterium]|nr:GntR family transcriptional regulator [Thiotrichaceae bacterium]